MRPARSAGEITVTAVYIIGERGSDVLKIGISTDPARRLNDLRFSNPYDIQVLWERPVEHARLVEKNVHQALASVRIRGEWFKIPLGDAIAVVERTIINEPIERMHQEWRDAWQARIDRQVSEVAPEPQEPIKPQRFPRV